MLLASYLDFGPQLFATSCPTKPPQQRSHTTNPAANVSCASPAMSLTAAQRAIVPAARAGLSASARATFSSRPLVAAALVSTASHTPSSSSPSSSPPHARFSPPQTRAFHTTRPNAISAPGSGAMPPTYFQKPPSLPMNTIVRFVPQQTAWIVERMGKFNRILQPGLAILIPFLDRIAYVKSLKEVAIEIPSQSAITADNVTLELDGVLYTRVFDAYKARCVFLTLNPPPTLGPANACAPPATASKTQNTPSPSSPKQPCAPKSANSRSTTSSKSAQPSTLTLPQPSTKPPKPGA